MSKTPLVAIVEDDADQIALLKRAFAMYGIPVAFVAFNGHEAVTQFEKAEKKPDVILMDYWMPAANGVDVAKRILALSPEVKIIFLSGERLDDEEAVEAGAATVLHKPASIRKIIDAIRSVAGPSRG